MGFRVFDVEENAGLCTGKLTTLFMDPHWGVGVLFAEAAENWRPDVGSVESFDPSLLLQQAEPHQQIEVILFLSLALSLTEGPHHTFVTLALMPGQRASAHDPELQPSARRKLRAALQRDCPRELSSRETFNHCSKPTQVTPTRSFFRSCRSQHEYSSKWGGPFADRCSS